ncbi:MAG: 2-oxo acid dehydrogenase subunit E2 [Pseudomonadota bacterium]|nr:2-oxo acid dehydrogenase subunit E2 [Pseudomonadota bacterium]
MAIKILMPALSPTMTEGNVAKWHVKEGDEVRPGDVIAEIETDKATMEVESIDEGVVGKIMVPEGAEGIQVNTTIGVLLEDGEDVSSIGDDPEVGAPAPRSEPVDTAQQPVKASSPPNPAPSTRDTDVEVSPLAKRIAEQTGVDLRSVVGSGIQGKIVKADVEAAFSVGGKPADGQVQIETDAVLPEPVDADGNRIAASPLARRMAADSNVDLVGIAGSGPNGRIVKTDVEAAIALRGAPQTAFSSTPAGDMSEIVKLSTVRKVIAQRMTESKSKVPHFYLTMDCELDELIRVRKALNDAQNDVKISVNDFVIRACAIALMEVPAANVAYEGEGEMRQHHTADISVAVAIPGGLITPIVRGAEKKGFKQISAEMKDLATRARDGKLLPVEYQGGSFSVSNLGMFGVKQFDAVINPPQACILAVGAGEQRPVVKSGEIVPATVMSCTLSVDHRVVDGAIGAELLAAVKRCLENPALMLL